MPARLLPTGAAPTLLGTVPVGRVWIVKNIRLVSREPVGPVAFSLWSGVDPEGGALFPAGATVPERSVVTDSDWWVLDEGDELHGYADAGDVSVRVSGAVLAR